MQSKNAVAIALLGIQNVSDEHECCSTGGGIAMLARCLFQPIKVSEIRSRGMWTPRPCWASWSAVVTGAILKKLTSRAMVLTFRVFLPYWTISILANHGKTCILVRLALCQRAVDALRGCHI